MSVRFDADRSMGASNYAETDDADNPIESELAMKVDGDARSMVGEYDGLDRPSTYSDFTGNALVRCNAPVRTRAHRCMKMRTRASGPVCGRQQAGARLGKRVEFPVKTGAMRPRSLVLSCLVALFACSPEEDDALAVEVREGTELPDGVEPASLAFGDDWTIAHSGGPLVAGNSVEVAYDVDRLTQCRGEQNGQPAWSIAGYHQLDGGELGSIEAGGHSPSQGSEPPIFMLEDSGDLAMWFHNTSVWGCSAYDSDFGANWHFQVGASLSFKAGWITEVLGTPRAGAPLVIAYDPARLPDCRATKYGHDAWNIKVHYRFDGGPAQAALLTAAEGNVQVPVPAVLDVPAAASEVEVWFENQDYYGCKAWDSLFGANYHFELE